MIGYHQLYNSIPLTMLLSYSVYHSKPDHAEYGHQEDAVQGQHLMQDCKFARLIVYLVVR